MRTLQATLRLLAKKAGNPELAVEDQIYLLLLFNELPDYKQQALQLFTQLSGGGLDWVKDDDIYIVCLRLLALYRHTPDSINGETLAKVAKRLITIERTVGGPYKHKAYSALQTNAAIAQCMRQFGAPLVNVEQFVQQEAEEHRLAVATPENGWLLAWPERIVSVPITRQLQTTDIDSLPQIVAKLCLRLRPGLPKTQKGSTLHYDDQAKAIVKSVMADSSSLPDPIRTLFGESVEMLARADASYEIRLLSTFFVESLTDTVASFSHTERPKALNKANLNTWVAYSLYDDFVDDEGDPRLLPVANVSHRRALGVYDAQAEGSQEARHLVETTFDQMDAANAWEVLHTRYTVDTTTITVGPLPNYGQKILLAERAGAHILGPLLIALLDTTASKAQYEELKEGLQHYLIARQLNDDVHDWVKDLRAGHISPVVAALLQKAKIQEGLHELDPLVAILQKTFWQSGLESVSEEILTHTQAAEQALLASGLVKMDGIFINKTLRPIVQSAQKALTKHRSEKQFLEIYKEVTVTNSQKSNQ